MGVISDKAEFERARQLQIDYPDAFKHLPLEELAYELIDHDHAPKPAPFFASLRSSVARATLVKSSCSRTFTAFHHSGPRPRNPVGVTWHCTQSSTALSAASWFANPRSAGSAQLCVDDKICYRTLLDGMIPWAAPGTNVSHVHVEMAGFVDWTLQQWLSHETMLKRAAYKTAVQARDRGFWVKWLGVDDLRNGNFKGITDHWAVSHAFGLSSHRDPRRTWESPAFTYPREHLLDLTKHYRAQFS